MFGAVINYRILSLIQSLHGLFIELSNSLGAKSMKYKKAQDILPKHVLELLQDYVDGEYLYIPLKNNSKKSWGEKSGLKKELSDRNREIYNKYQRGMAISQLIGEYYLTESSIRRIIRSEKLRDN